MTGRLAHRAPAPGPVSAGAAVTRLDLIEFRSYAALRLEPGPHPVALLGPNGAGKTNILEAISFLAPGKGLRRARGPEPERRGAAQAWAVAARVTKGGDEIRLGTGGGGAGKRVLRVDGKPARGQQDFAAAIAVVWLTPEMDRLFAEGPGARRRFLDRLVFGFDPEHAGRVAAYEHSMRERARLLAEGARDEAWLASLEDSMARHGIAIAIARGQTVARLARACRANVSAFPAPELTLAGELETLVAEMPALAAEDRARDILAARRMSDAESGATGFGPHRADLAARWAAKNQPAGALSTGEQKALLISLVLAYARELAAERGSPPVLLLDEICAHLDPSRRAALFDELDALGAQYWATGADPAAFAPLRDRALLHAVGDGVCEPTRGSP
ncbi:MAG: DNA replication/repair protein RecF [Tagaea sp.]|nr:DNA replication/repair protein RecF [Tagaea sp.]